ncbi:hypothetical protein T440DRAFT_485244 [Plenodomus tracheiphilus IPT5]|uniref:Zn(2)-C6 fungal-type domain-containing protein n=1 Tax=Plenodomus tracheiphilus IPT5 TaxID=1408161 RepID=A0A6A7BPG9_9PLEO|nr:hypothetical protein T440DRAFT_485244 [Plenodomus tracheiphilus IPT5]
MHCRPNRVAGGHIIWRHAGPIMLHGARLHMAGEWVHRCCRATTSTVEPCLTLTGRAQRTPNCSDGRKSRCVREALRHLTDYYIPFSPRRQVGRSSDGSDNVNTRVPAASKRRLDSRATQSARHQIGHQIGHHTARWAGRIALRNTAHLAFASSQPALHLAPRTFWGTHRRPPLTTTAAGPCLDTAEHYSRAGRPRNPPSLLVLSRRPIDPENTAKIFPLREQGAAGAPAPPPGENGAPRLNAVTAYPHHHPTRPPPSPVGQASPSTVEESPQRTPGPTRVRASIACLKCRSSKTKCDNEGDEKTACKACKLKNTDCIYQSSTGSNVGSASRRESTADGDRKATTQGTTHVTGVPIYSASQRPKSVIGLGSVEDALESPMLTAEVWAELFGIYETHLAIDFPFFHRRVFLSCIRERPPIGMPSECISDSPSVMPQPHYPPLLLAFLTQTARFCPKLVEQKNNDPVETATFYADATRYQMGKCDFPGVPTLEKVQALLLLGYHEWTALQGTKGWVRIGTAIRCAQGLGYQFDADQDNRPIVVKEYEQRLSEKDHFILREVQRRTFWSCCLLDRYLSWGGNRPPMLNAKCDFQRIQLPCSRGSFEFGRKVRTRLLGETNAAYTERRKQIRELGTRQYDRRNNPQRTVQFDEVKWEVEPEGELLWYITIVDLFGEIVKWSCNGGRRQEGTIPPWDDNTEFRKLEKKLQQFKTELPDQLQLTAENNQDRVYNGSEPYLLIHALYTVCTVFLYREYMAMAPWTVQKPVGPLDEPLIRAIPPSEDYWIEQARRCWKVCKEFIDFLDALQSARTSAALPLPQVPTVAFASFTVALCTIYCHYFPNMDPDRNLSSRRQPRAHDVAHKYLGTILERFPMAVSWVKQLASWQRYYRDTRARYKESGGKVGDSPQSSTSDTGGGGLKDYLDFFEKTHKEFGDMNAKHDRQWTDKEQDLADSGLPHEDNHADHNAPSNTGRMKRETEEVRVNTPVQASPGFTSVNQPRPNPANEQRVPIDAPVVGEPCYAQHGNAPGEERMRPRAHVQPYYDHSYSYVGMSNTHIQPSVTHELPRAGPIPDPAGYNPEAVNQMELDGRTTFHTYQDFAPNFFGEDSVSLNIPLYNTDPNGGYYPAPFIPNSGFAGNDGWSMNHMGMGGYPYPHQPQ